MRGGPGEDAATTGPASAVTIDTGLASLATLPAVATLGRHELLGRIATGGMAEIFLARVAGPRDVARLVVVKRLLPHVAENAAVVDAFVQEAKLGSRLAHPSLCAITDFGHEDDAYFIAMEWVRGASLRALMERTRGKLPIHVAARIFADLATALHHAHTATDDAGRPLGVVHRDVTPENVVVSWGGVPKLLDFGIAKSAFDPRKTEAGVLKGKLAYISPEQYRGDALDARSDVFALSVCLYEALTGESLYERASEYETVAAIVLDASVPSPRAVRADVPEAIDELVRAGLTKDRDARLPSADALARGLESWLAKEHGAPVRHADVARSLDALFPGMSRRPPALDRRPPTTRASTPPSARKRTSSEEMRVLALGAEIDHDEDRLLGDARRTRRNWMLLALLVTALSIGVVAWVALTPH